LEIGELKNGQEKLWEKAKSGEESVKSGIFFTSGKICIFNFRTIVSMVFLPNYSFYNQVLDVSSLEFCAFCLLAIGTGTACVKKFVSYSVHFDAQNGRDKSGNLLV